MCVISSHVDELNDVQCELLIVICHIMNINDVE